MSCLIQRNPGQPKPHRKSRNCYLIQLIPKRNQQCQICCKPVEGDPVFVRGQQAIQTYGQGNKTIIQKRGRKQYQFCAWNSSLGLNYGESVSRRRKTAVLGLLLALPMVVARITLSFDTILEVLKQSCLLRQQVAFLLCFVIVRYMLAGLIKGVRSFFEVTIPWERCVERQLMLQVSAPLQILLVVASIFSLAQNTLPMLIPSLTTSAVEGFTKRLMSFITIGIMAFVALGIKAEYINTRNDQQVSTKTTNAVDKMITIAVITAFSIILLKNLGFDLQSLLTLGGVGGIALGLAGQEILQNLLHGILIIGSSAFEVGDEVVFWYNNGWKVEGIVMDIGWYRSSIRSFDREVFSIPNSVFSKTVVLNVSRKMGEWRIRHDFGLRLEDLRIAPKVLSDIRRILKQERRVIQKLPIRVFITGITREQVTIFMNFFVTAKDREDYVCLRQDMLLSVMSCVKRNDAHLARNRYMVEVSRQHQLTSLNSSTQYLVEDKLNQDGLLPDYRSQDFESQIIVDPHLMSTSDSYDADFGLVGGRIQNHTIRSGIRDRKGFLKF
eukprot:TRINITY_DN4644_c0_g2_i4.p1 TRINITY_DN4644_c0_g2~~TRINITY_DN4644_c0_g2_i4.p1  ORF type:complete len:553 (+),score=33.41 TRINITY_DN4644_c0_g2_i4:83-1741(+)